MCNFKWPEYDHFYLAIDMGGRKVIVLIGGEPPDRDLSHFEIGERKALPKKAQVFNKDLVLVEG